MTTEKAETLHGPVPHDMTTANDDSALRKAIETAINMHSAENGSDTPDFILAEYLTDCLRAFDQAVRHREKWYGRREFV